MNIRRANIEDRAADNLLAGERFSFLRNLTGTPVARFQHGEREFIVQLEQIDHLDRGDSGYYPFGYNARWIACAMADGDPLALYEFFAGPADLFDQTIEGAKLVGSAITVDAAHTGQGIARAMVRSLYGAGIFIVPSDKMTTAGARLFNALEAEGVAVPVPDQITCPWPYEAA